jgi:hypothetical protein
MRDYDKKEYLKQKANRQKLHEILFIQEYKNLNPRHMQVQGNEEGDDDESIPNSIKGPVRNIKKKAQNVILRQLEFNRRIQPVKQDANQKRIDQMFKVHQMNELGELKQQYTEVARLLDDGTEDEIDRFKMM